MRCVYAAAVEQRLLFKNPVVPMMFRRQLIRIVRIDLGRTTSIDGRWSNSKRR